MSTDEYGRFLNMLLECERAGAKLLAAYCDELPAGSDTLTRLSRVQRDEARNCSVLIHLLLDSGFEPSTAVGAFYRKGLQIRGWPQRVAYLNRGQQWVADRLAVELPALEGTARRQLEVMYRSHLENIRLCEAAA